MATAPPAASSGPIHSRPRQSPWPAIPMEQAWQMVGTEVGTVLGQQLRRVEERRANETAAELLGMVVAEPVSAARPVPAFRASIKDGYALIAADGPGRREVIGISTAGGAEEGSNNQADQQQKQQPTITVASGQCVRINTGARVPEGADAVVQVEDTAVLEHDEHEELAVDIRCTPKAGQDIRQIGSDLSEGEMVLDRGTQLGPPEIGLLPLSGRKKVLVFARPRVCVLSTGDELVNILSAKSNAEEEDEERRPDAVVDTNRPMLLALFRSNRFEPVDCGIAGDSEQALVEALQRAFTQADVLVVSGGVSMGEKDLLKQMLSQHFHMQIHFGRVFMKPGLPTTFASGAGPDGRAKFVFGLPGNPVSALVTAHLFVVPQLRRISGLDSPHWETRRLNVKLTHPIRPLDSRPEYRRAILLPPSPPCCPLLPMAKCVPGHQLSSRLASACTANLLLELPAKSEQIQGLDQGDTVNALVIGQL